MAKRKAEPTDGGRRNKSQMTVSRRRTQEEIDEDATPIKEKFVSRMSLSGFFKFINLPPSVNQLADIESMGFGGLMKIKTDVVPGKLPFWLVSTFDTASCSLMDGKLDVTEMDIHLATGLPMGPIPVNLVSKCCNDDQFQSEKNKWLLPFGVGGKVTKKVLLDKIISQTEGGDEFKRNFIVYVVNTLPMGVKGDLASTRVLSCLKDLSKVASFNWCAFVLDNLIDTVDSWREDKTKGYKGPIMILVFIYLDRVSFKRRKNPRVFPTLRNWDRKEINDRIREEYVGGFGKGRVVARLVLESSVVGECSKVVGKKELEADVDVLDKENILATLGKAAFQLRQSYDHFSSILSQAQIAVPTSDLVNKWSAAAKDSETLYQSLPTCPPEEHVMNEIRPDLRLSAAAKDSETLYQSLPKCPPEEHVMNEIRPDLNLSRPSEVANEVEMTSRTSEVANEVEMTSGGNVEKGPPDSFTASQTTDELLVAALLEIEKPLPPRQVDDNPENVTCSIKTEEIVAPDESLETTSEANIIGHTALIPSSQNSDDVLLQALENVERSRPTVTKDGEVDEEKAETETHALVCSDFESTQESQGDPVFMEPTVRRSPRFGGTASGSGVAIGSPPLPSTPTHVDPIIDSALAPKLPLEITPLSSLPSLEAVVSKKLSKRAIIPTEYFKSPFMRRNIDISRDLTKLENSIVDLALIEDESHADSEILFQNERHTLTRLDLKTLVSGERVAESVIRVWCEILNKGEEQKSSESPLRHFFFLDIGDSVEAQKCDLNDVKLVFLPILSPDSRPYLFCANLLTSQLEVIHAMTPKSVPYDGSIKNHRDALIKLLTGRMQSVDIINALGVHEFVPQQHIGDLIDSGIHVMYFMDTYMGKRGRYVCKLSNGNFLKRFSVKVCCRISTSDLNSLKEKFQKQAQHVTLGSCPPTPPKYSISYLKNFVRSTKLDANNLICVDTPWMQVTLKDLRTLLPRKWVSATVIDMVGVLTCQSEPGFLYLPTVVKDFRLYTQYVKMDYIPSDGADVKKVFLPILKDDHWFACVCDLERHTSFVLNSLRPKKKDEQLSNDFVLDVIYHVEKNFKKIHGYRKLIGMSLFTLENVKVPKQKNTHDCGVHVLKFIDAGNNETLWTQEKHYSDLAGYREATLLDLLKCRQNRIKDFEIPKKQPVQKKTTRR